MTAPEPKVAAPVGGVLELLNTGDSVGGIKAEAHALVRGAGGPREVQGARILARCDELEANLAEARTAVEAMAEALDLLLHDRTPWSVTCAREALARYHGRTES